MTQQFKILSVEAGDRSAVDSTASEIPSHYDQKIRRCQ
jgi:hypothetical protein